MNHTSDHSYPAPINRLPTEILSYIFRLLSTNPSRCHNPVATSGVLGEPAWYPDCLAHVCSRWRNIVISLPSFWTHIDLTPDTLIGQGFADLAWAYTQRAGNLPLNIHIDDKGCTSDNYSTLDNMVQSLAPRMGTLDFVITAPELVNFHGSVLNSLFPGLSPNVLKCFRMRSEFALPAPFVWCRDGWADSEHHNLGPNMLKWTSDVIDNCVSGLTSLHLRGVFFNWSSGLYHDLVDLRLTAPLTGRVPFIDPPVLVSILRKSPRLRIFFLSLRIATFDGAGDSWLTQAGGLVSLPDLEVLLVSTTRTGTHVSSLLRLIAPGSKPLRLTLETGFYEDLFEPDGVNEFFTRSKVERLCIRDGNLSVNELRLCTLPDLKVLVFDFCHRITIEAAPISPPRWSSCLVHATNLDLYELRSMAKLCSTGLVISACNIRRKLRLEEEELIVPEAELRAAFPTVQFLTDTNSSFDPTEDWDILD